MIAPPSALDRLHILHLEDNSFDGELTGLALHKEWPFARIDRVESRDEFLAALAREDFDLILSDYTIPGFSGLEALELVCRLKPELPYIFFSGTIGEDRAVEALRRGATDYVLKDRPGRLVQAVKRALDLASKRQDPALARIAHNLNNAFGPILLALPLIREHMIDDRMSGLLDTVETSTRRGADLVRELQGFSRTRNTESGDAAGEAPPSAQAGLNLKAGHPRTILVIDDEDCVRKVTKALLETSGYRVILASDGAAGVAAYRSRQDEIQAILTDVTMPGMQGTEVVRELRAINPAVGIVVMSGLGNPGGLIGESGPLAFVSKPMTRTDLLDALMDVLPAAPAYSP